MESIFPDKKESIEDKLRKWVLIGLVALVGGGAAIMVIVSVAKKLLG